MAPVITETPAVTPPPDIQTIALEVIPGEVGSFYGPAEDPAERQGTGTFMLAYTDQHTPQYRFTYTIPDEGNGYAGWYYRFTSAQDLTEYTAIEVTIAYQDTNAKVQIGLEDATGNQAFIRLADGFVNATKIDVSVAEDTQRICIPLQGHFPAIDTRTVQNLSFGADASFTRGHHTFTVSDITFIRTIDIATRACL